MRRKNLMTALLCAAVVAASTVMAPGVVMAEETEAVTEAVTEASTEAATEADTEALTEASTEEALELAERPDYKALDYVELGEYKGLTVEVEPTGRCQDRGYGRSSADLPGKLYRRAGRKGCSLYRHGQFRKADAGAYR